MAEKSIFETVGRLLPRARLLAIQRSLERAGVDFSAEAYIGLLGILVVFFTFLFAFLAIRLVLPARYIHDTVFLLVKSDILYYAVLLLLSFLVSLLSVIIVSSVIIGNMAEDRRKKVDLVLPDFLLLASANVRAGMSIDQALWYASRSEFGLLSKEVELIAKNSFSGEPFDVSIDRLVKRFNSKQVRRAVTLIKQSILSGGELASVLEQTAHDSRKMQIIEKQISASLVSYVVFISFLAAVGTPLLFSVAHSLIEFLFKSFANITTTQSVNVGSVMFNPQRPSISPDDFLVFSVAVLLLTAISSSLLVGIIRTGKKDEGIKYMPLFIILGLLVYYFLAIALSQVVSSFS